MYSNIYIFCAFYTKYTFFVNVTRRSNKRLNQWSGWAAHNCMFLISVCVVHCIMVCYCYFLMGNHNNITTPKCNNRGRGSSALLSLLYFTCVVHHIWYSYLIKGVLANTKLYVCAGYLWKYFIPPEMVLPCIPSWTCSAPMAEDITSLKSSTPFDFLIFVMSFMIISLL